jgi:hypothetical protein
MFFRVFVTVFLAGIIVLSVILTVPNQAGLASISLVSHQAGGRWLWLLAAFPSSAGSALFQWREQWLPNTDKMPADTFPQIWQSWSNFIADPSLGTASRIPHSLNNLTTELVRADAEYWSKILLLIIAIQFIIILWRRRLQRS